MFKRFITIVMTFVLVIGGIASDVVVKAAKTNKKVDVVTTASIKDLTEDQVKEIEDVVKKIYLYSNNKDVRLLTLIDKTTKDGKMIYDYWKNMLKVYNGIEKQINDKKFMKKHGDIMYKKVNSVTIEKIDIIDADTVAIYTVAKYDISYHFKTLPSLRNVWVKDKTTYSLKSHKVIMADTYDYDKRYNDNYVTIIKAKKK